MKRAFKLKLEIRVSQNLGKLGANSFPGSPWEMSRRVPWEGGWFRGWMAREILGMVTV